MGSEKDYQDWLKSTPEHLDPDGMAMKIREQTKEIAELKAYIKQEEALGEEFSRKYKPHAVQRNKHKRPQ